MKRITRKRIKKLVKAIKLTGIALLIAIALGIIYICISSGDDTQKMNICLQKHNLNYCNKEVK